MLCVYDLPGMVPQLIQSHGILEEDADDVRRILSTADPYMTQAANISPLQYIYDELHPMLYLGHEYPMRLRKKGIAQVHTDMGGGMLGYEVTPYLIKQLLSSVEESREIRKGGMPQ